MSSLSPPNAVIAQCKQ